jgi:SHS2 domain-containing protein
MFMTQEAEPSANAITSLISGRWEHFPHDADIGVRGRGPSLEVAFEQAALALSAVITDLDRIENTEEVCIQCQAPQLDLLFMDWLNAVVFEMATRGMLFGDFQVEIDGNRLNAVARGEKVDRNRHEPAAEIKGATFTELAVVQESDGSWLAQCIVDV